MPCCWQRALFAVGEPAAALCTDRHGVLLRAQALRSSRRSLIRVWLSLYGWSSSGASLLPEQSYLPQTLGLVKNDQPLVLVRYVAVLLQEDADEAAQAMRGPPPLPAASWAEAPEQAAAALAARRVALTERETALQRWAAALALEGARHAAATASLAATQQQVWRRTLDRSTGSPIAQPSAISHHFSHQGIHIV